ncbi:efflux transporter outer membrane subunit [Bdellovibrio sp. HCB185ZH]|uniref:efflux transporter outer membrane subunit n=1 Tax=Bdellovibrio sp. HCB185ZH TaxID=3394235 RepID=UPI0039A73107
MKKRWLIAGLSTYGFLCACAVGPDYKRPTENLPSALFANSTEQNIELGWWKQFGDGTLDKLIQMAFDHNLDLELALARVDEARARLGISKSQYFPSLDLRGSAIREKVTETGMTPIPQGSDSIGNSFLLGLSLSYEIDLWGKIRRSNESAKAQLLSADYNRANVQLTLLSQVVSGYFALRSLDLQYAIAQDTLKSRIASYELMFRRFKGGIGSELDARQSESEMRSAEATVSKLDDQISRAESFLSVLIGKNPKEIIETPLARGRKLDEIVMPPQLPSSLPSSLLERRPDILAAEQNLVSANALIGVAKAYYFPSISLGGIFGYESSELKNLFNNSSQTWGYGASISMPIFNGGRTGYLVEAATAQQKAAEVQYRQAIQNAFVEVRNALKTYQSYGDVVDAQRKQVVALERNLYLAQLRYKNGQSPYLEVLDAERNLFSVQLDLVKSQQSRLVSVVDLYKSLGGGWKPDMKTSSQ